VEIVLRHMSVLRGNEVEEPAYYQKKLYIEWTFGIP
jgi:hypothetical protein